jgi:riboflavin kinase/FMN adenylyltransferase
LKIIRDYTFLNKEDKGACVAIGNFDGVHKGHLSVIELARAAAETLNTAFGVITFEPHPRAYFQPTSKPFRLMSAEARASQLEKVGINNLYELQFNSALSSLSADQFINDVLVNGLGVKHIVVGEDFCFGKNRSGSVKMLEEYGRKLGFGVTIAPLVEDNKWIFSSTSIRNAITDGRPDDAAHMLGHWYRIEGTVISGDQRGRELGYPTANMSLDGLHLPKFGVYAVIADILTGPYKGRFFGAASLGERPTFGVNIPNLETFIFDFSGDIYEEELSIALVSFQRPELKFDNLDDLIKQMDQDCKTSIKILKDKVSQNFC